MTDLPQIEHGHAPLDVCHKTHSGVTIHVIPGCECVGPAVLHPETREVVAKAPNHVDIWEKGQRRSVSIAEARAAGLVI